MKNVSLSPQAINDLVLALSRALEESGNDTPITTRWQKLEKMFKELAEPNYRTLVPGDTIWETDQIEAELDLWVPVPPKLVGLMVTDHFKHLYRRATS